MLFTIAGKSFYLSFFHSRHRNDNCFIWQSYYMGAYLFTTEPPFEIFAISRAPLYHPTWYQGPWMERIMPAWHFEYVYFPTNFFFTNIETGLVLQDIQTEENCDLDCMGQYNITMSYGFNDVDGYTLNMNLADLFRTLNHFKHEI